MQRSSIDLLPQDVRAELEKRLVAGGFADYRGLADWLGEHGFEISKSALHRYGQRFEERLASLQAATDAAKRVVEASPDDEASISEAILRLTQEKIFGILLDLEVDPSKVNLASLSRSVAELARATVSQKKWSQKVKSAMAAKLNESRIVSGLTAEAKDQLKRELLGVVG